MGFTAHETLIMEKELSDDILKKLCNKWECTDSIIVGKFIDTNKVLYILEHRNDRLLYMNLHEFLETDSEIYFINYDDSYSNYVTLYRANKDEHVELEEIDEDFLFDNSVKLGSLNEYLGLSEQAIKYLEDYYNEIYD